MRRAIALSLGLAAALTAAGCFRYQSVDPRGPDPAQRVRIASAAPFDVQLLRSSGADPDVCRALEVRGSVVSASGDTLVLGAPLEMVAAPDQGMCAFERGQRVRVAPRASDVTVIRADVAMNVFLAFVAGAALSVAIAHY